MALFKVPKKSREQKLKKLTPEQRAEMDHIEAQAIADFKGDPHDLESAIGMLRIGHHSGWKVLYIIHSKRTIRKYEQILAGDSGKEVRIRDLFESEGPSAYRSVGFQIVQKVSNFWKVIANESTEATLPKDKRHKMSA
jgi:hypothetical protein